jgi:hypothetical protein
VDGLTDPQNDQIVYIGTATRQYDGMYRCLASVGGSLCIVEVKLTVNCSGPSGTTGP